MAQRSLTVAPLCRAGECHHILTSALFVASLCVCVCVYVCHTQAGDITHGDGSGGRAYGGRWLQPEALKPSGNPIHAYMTQRPLGVRYGRGVVSMLVKPENGT